MIYDLNDRIGRLSILGVSLNPIGWLKKQLHGFPLLYKIIVRLIPLQRLMNGCIHKVKKDFQKMTKMIHMGVVGLQEVFPSHHSPGHRMNTE